MTLMYDIDAHSKIDGFRKLGLLAGFSGLSPFDIAVIVGEDPALVQEVLRRGSLPHSLQNTEEIFRKLYLVRAVLSSVLRLGDYSQEGAKEVLSDVEDFQNCSTLPPWYPRSLHDYLLEEKMSGAQKALDWLRKF